MSHVERTWADCRFAPFVELLDRVDSRLAGWRKTWAFQFAKVGPVLEQVNAV